MPARVAARRRKMVAEDDPRWVRCWGPYPRHQAKLDARVAFAQLDPDEATMVDILVALGWQCATDGWRRGYVPLFGTYLRGRRWEDERPLVEAYESITHEERARAVQMRKAWGSCQHDPSCESYAACVTAIVLGWRR